MAQWDKLLARIKSLDKNMRFLELKKVLESYGYTVFVYVRMVKEIVESEEQNKED